MCERAQSPGEEIANSVSHGAALVAAAVAAPFPIVAAVGRGATAGVVGASVFGAAMVLLYAASMLYHAIPHPRAKRVFRKLDHGAIYLLIAGTYTPFLLLTLGDTFGAVLMVVIWSLAVAGIVFKIFFLHRFHNLSLAMYLGMGWLAILASYQLLAAMPHTGIALLLGGGILYSLGTIFYKVDRIPFNHAIWHLFVLAACVLHFLALYFYVLPVG